MPGGIIWQIVLDCLYCRRKFKLNVNRLMKMKFTRFTTKFALIIALAVTGYLVGATTVAVTTAVTTIAAEEEDDCERDRCGAVISDDRSWACEDWPHKETGCDAKYSWWSGRHYCETYDCD